MAILRDSTREKIKEELYCLEFRRRGPKVLFISHYKPTPVTEGVPDFDLPGPVWSAADAAVSGGLAQPNCAGSEPGPAASTLAAPPAPEAEPAAANPPKRPRGYRRFDEPLAWELIGRVDKGEYPSDSYATIWNEHRAQGAKGGSAAKRLLGVMGKLRASKAKAP
jgi:hypothetical protein